MLEAIRNQLATSPDSCGSAHTCSVALEGSGIVFLFGLNGYASDVRFGYRLEAIPMEGTEDWSPESWAGVAIANWREAFEAADTALPDSRGASTVLWINGS